MLLHKDKEQFEAIINAVSNELKLPVSIVEKDYDEITSYFQKERIDYSEAITVIDKVIELGIF